MFWYQAGSFTPSAYPYACSYLGCGSSFELCVVSMYLRSCFSVLCVFVVVFMDFFFFSWFLIFGRYITLGGCFVLFIFVCIL